MATSKHFPPMTKDILNKLTPTTAFDRLREGNARFVTQRLVGHQDDGRTDLNDFVTISAKGQYPFAIVLSCVDSRIPTETILDQTIGDMFNARIAGNFVNQDILGSMEFACTRTDENDKPIGAKVILVLGHTGCGAITGATQMAAAPFPPTKESNLTRMLQNLLPAVKTTQRDSRHGEMNFVDRVAKKNVELTIDNILLRSEALRELHNSGTIRIEGAMYDVKTGIVTFFNDK